jgi:hypothetical protein
MADTVKTYDPKAVICTFGGIALQGFANGTFLVAQRDEDLFTKSVGADGSVERAKSNNKAGNCVFTLQQTSPSNDVLSGFALADELRNEGVKPLLIKDLSGRTLLFAASAWIRKTANASFGKEVETREWTIDCASMDMFVGGNG